MNTNSTLGVTEKALKTVRVDGVYIVDKRLGYNRRHKTHKCIKEYERRITNLDQNCDRRRRSSDTNIDIVI
ncbi:MAG: hypothetical protein ACI9UD_001536 [Glaciecola sp.]|jgi:hypothetical protein